MKKFFIILFILTLPACYDTKNSTGNNQSDKNIHRFELHKTKNIFNSLLLDNRTGRIWQIQYSLDDKSFEGAAPLSLKMYAKENGKNGRFKLTSTQNIWTFLLTDTSTGAVWHCQWGLDNKAFIGCSQIVNSISQ